jgi:AcrR family transcriptional regulator
MSTAVGLLSERVAMATQSERRARTRAKVVKVARRMFGKRGFAATTMDGVATAAGVAKGAVYHHFPTKEALFEAVLEDVAGALVHAVQSETAAEYDPLKRLVAGTRAYFAACGDGPTGQILLRDAPAVLGWERFRELDRRYFGGVLPGILRAAMDAGVIRRQPVEPLARLLLGAVTEAAVACTAATDITKAGAEFTAAFASIVEALRLGSTTDERSVVGQRDTSAGPQHRRSLLSGGTKRS